MNEPITKDELTLSNTELASAIDKTREMLRSSAPDSPAYNPLSAHFKLLLDVQYKRACGAAQP